MVFTMGTCTRNTFDTALQLKHIAPRPDQSRDAKVCCMFSCTRKGLDIFTLLKIDGMVSETQRSDEEPIQLNNITMRLDNN